jgi:hypothetical protein
LLPQAAFTQPVLLQFWQVPPTHVRPDWQAELAEHVPPVPHLQALLHVVELLQVQIPLWHDSPGAQLGVAVQLPPSVRQVPACEQYWPAEQGEPGPHSVGLRASGLTSRGTSIPAGD